MPTTPEDTLKLHQFRPDERQRPDREQAHPLLAALLGVGPGLRCLVPAM